LNRRLAPQRPGLIRIKSDATRIPANPTHPGEVLLEEFLKPRGITQTRLAEHLRTSIQRVNELINGKRSITAETAWLLSEAFATTPQFWISVKS
jgi:addiction module HigA family antidote